MIKHPTKRRAKIFQFIVGIMDEYGIPSGLREVAEVFSFKFDEEE